MKNDPSRSRATALFSLYERFVSLFLPSFRVLIVFNDSALGPLRE